MTVTRKMAKPLSERSALAFVDEMMAFPMVAIEGSLVLEGIHHSIRYGISYWDGAIVAAAERLKCKTLYTEDLSHGQVYGTVQAVNPFV